jgi:hypothetical protein
MRLARPLLLSAAALLATSCTGHPTAPDVFTWSGRVPPGGWLRLRNLNGVVMVAQSPDDVVRVRATKRYRGRRPQPVRFEVNPEGDATVVCALWGERGGRCTSERYQAGSSAASWWRRTLFGEGQVNVEFVVAVPAGVRVDARTVNGRVTVADVVGEVRVSTTNGAVVLAAQGGPVHVRSVNGSIRLHVGELAPGAELEAETVNGSVTALAPASLAGDVELATVNGSARTDFALANGTASGKQVRGAIGGGGPTLRLRTVNGSVRLLRVGSAGGVEDEGEQ